MIKQLNFLILLVFLVFKTQGQQTVGLSLNSIDAFDGYTLFLPLKNRDTYLIDNCGEKVHSWPSNNAPALSPYLLEDGTLLRPGRIPDESGSSIVEMIDWDGNVIWDYSASDTHGMHHHDIEYLPNGNILLIVYDFRTSAEFEEAGSLSHPIGIHSEQIIEIKPDLITGGATVVWEWKAMDHLIQDSDPMKPNFGTISEHPERIDINYLDNSSSFDWLHFNAIDYNEGLDQIVVSSHAFSEFWIIDHSTTTTEAASSSGGNNGKGGDLLYRWGNPQAYDRGTPDDQKLFFQHHTHWIPESLDDAGKILVYNNRAGTPIGQDYSTVNIVNTPVDEDGFYPDTEEAYAPIDFDWTYQAPNPTDFFSIFISGAQRLQNGNTLICEGGNGRFFEIDKSGNIVWEYVNPINNEGPMTQNDLPENNNVFRCLRYASDYSGFEGHTLEPQGYLEIGSTFDCDLFSSVSDHAESMAFDVVVYPNLVSEYFEIQFEGAAPISDFKSIKIRSMLGSVVYYSQKLQDMIDVTELPKGTYVIQFDFGKQQLTKKLIIH